MNYGQKIAEFRKSANLTQAELGAKLNITAQAVSKWENSLSEPDIDSIRKMCEIFNVSVDEFIGVSVKKEETAQVSASQPVKAILGYCSKCNKAVCAGEFKTAKIQYNAGSVNNKVVNSIDPNTYCNECYEELTAIKQKETAIKNKAKYEQIVHGRKKTFWLGLIWGFVVMALVAVAFFTFYAKDPSITIATPIILAVAGLTITSQFIWGYRSDDGESALIDVFEFFCRSFSSPFHYIFELSLDGILWLLTVKLVMWIICGILSIVWFIIGLFVTSVLSIILFPFSLASHIRSFKKL